MSQNKRGTIPIDSVVEEFFVRTRLNDDHVVQISQLYAAGVHLPAIQVTRDHNKLVDGRHRLAALKLLDKKSVDVEWLEETDTGTILATALLANIGGSLPPTNGDIVYAMGQMLEAGMVGSAITKHFSSKWPPAVVRRYLAEANSKLGHQRVVKAKNAVVDQGMTVYDAAILYKVKPDILKDSINGVKRTKKGQAEINAGLTSIFKSRGSKMGAIMRRVQHAVEDGDMSWKHAENVLDHLDRLCKSTTTSARDWRKRMEAKAGKTTKVDQ